MYLEFNNMERGMKGTRIVTVEKKGLPFYWLWACALMHTDTSKDILCARRRHVLCVVLYMHGMQQTKSNVNIIHFKEINTIDKYVDLVVTYWKVCAIVMVWDNEDILNSHVYTL